MEHCQINMAQKPEKNEAGLMSALLQGVIDILKSHYDIVSIDREQFVEDLISESGATKRKGNRGRDHEFLSASLELVGAQIALRNASIWRKRILGIRGVDLSETLLLTLTFSWDRMYVARERLRRWVDAVKCSDATPEQVSRINALVRAYKTKTDALLRPRAEHVHRSDVHHPLVAQLRTLELVTKVERSGRSNDPEFVAFMKTLKRNATHRSKIGVSNELDDAEAKLVALTDEVFVNIMSSLDGRLTFAPIFAVTIVF